MAKSLWDEPNLINYWTSPCKVEAPNQCKGDHKYFQIILMMMILLFFELEIIWKINLWTKNKYTLNKKNQKSISIFNDKGTFSE